MGKKIEPYMTGKVIYGSVLHFYVIGSMVIEFPCFVSNFSLFLELEWTCSLIA